MTDHDHDTSAIMVSSAVVTIDARSVSLQAVLEAHSPVDRLAALQHIFAVTDDEIREVRDYVGDMAFGQFVDTVTAFRGRLNRLAAEMSAQQEAEVADEAGNTSKSA